MKPNAKPSKTPTPAEFAVVVQSLTPRMSVLIVEPIEDFRPGETLPLYGGYTSQYDNATRLYLDGDTPNDWRLAVEEDGYDNEILFRPLPDHIRELDLSEYPAGSVEIVVDECRVIPMPRPEGKVVAFTPPADTLLKPLHECRVIEHAATTQLRRGKQYPAAQLAFPFAEQNQQTQNAS